jgi:DNA-binding FadR family transcriptional regulator
MASSELLPQGENQVQRATRLIGSAIVRGDHAAEGLLPVEAEMCRTLGVGRNVLREAVKTLAGKGLLATARRAGTRVRPRREWHLLDPAVLAWAAEAAAVRAELLADLTQLRLMLEPEVAAAAARSATAGDSLRLLEAYEAMQRHARDPVRAVEADIAFHERLFEAAHNQLLGSLWRAFAVLLRANFDITIQAVGGYIRNLEVHGLVAEAVRAGDEGAARAAMQRLLANNEQDLAAMMRRDREGAS